MKKEVLFFTLAYSILVFCTLITSKSFVDYTHCGVYLYIFISSLLFCAILLKSIFKKIAISCSSLTLCFAGFILYVLINSWLNNVPNALKSEKFIVLLFSFFHFLLFSFFIKSWANGSSGFIRPILFVFLFASLFQAFYSYMQIIGILNNSHSSFSMGGTLGNPNVLANFLALSGVMAINYALHTKNRKDIFIVVFSLMIILPIIILSKCRTAWVALCIGAIASVYWRFPIWFKSIKGVICVCISIIVLIFFITKLYTFKKTSADSRMYTWTQTMFLIKNKPVLGFGYNQFEKTYNLFQAKQFKSIPENRKDYSRDTYVESTYNDYIEIWFETGIIGLALFILIFVSAFRTKQNRPIIFPSLMAWMFVSVVNYNCVLPFNMLFLSFLLSIALQEKTKIYILKVNKIIAVFLLIICVVFIVGKFQNFQSELKLQSLISNKNREKIYPKEVTSIYPHLEKTGKLLHYYALLFQRQRNLNQSLIIMNEAATVSSNYNIYIALGRLYNLKKEYERSIENYHTALNICPYLLTPRYELMLVYDKTGNERSALREAERILEIPPKVPAEKAGIIKMEALKYKNSHN